MRRRAEERKGEERATMPQPPLVERGSRGEDLGSMHNVITPVELSSRGGLSRGGPRRAVDQVWTGGHCLLNDGAQVTESGKGEDGDRVMVRGSKDLHVEWMVRNLASRVDDRVAQSGKNVEDEVVAIEDDAGPRLSPRVARSEVVVVQKVTLDHGNLNLARGIQLGTNVDPVLGHVDSLMKLGEMDGLPMGLGSRFDPLAENLGQKLGLDHGDWHNYEESGLGDPLLLYEVDRSMKKTVGRDVGLHVGVVFQNLGWIQLRYVGGLCDIALSSQVNFGDAAVQLVVVPPTGFSWKFSEGVWALFPVVDCLRVVSVIVPSDTERSEGKRGFAV